MRHSILWLAGSTLAALSLLTAQVALAEDTATVDTRTSQEYGAYLVDSKGMSLYLFEPDKQGKSTCYDACAQVWPPMITGGAPKAQGKVDASLLGSIKRKDGSSQVTYNGWPLYYFVKDKEPGDTKGQDVKGFGGEWYLVAPDGSHVGH